MTPSVRLVAPGRLQIREGGGCLSVFGLPFFGAGIFMLLSVLGLVTIGNEGEVTRWTWLLLAVMGIVFTLVGGGLAFGRSWTTIDSTDRQLVSEWGLLRPMRAQTTPLGPYTSVELGFIEGDSDTSDQFPVTLKTGSGPGLRVCSFTQYADALTSASAVASHLHLELVDASTDHPVRLTADEAGRPLQDRLPNQHRPTPRVERPPTARSEVHDEGRSVRIVIPRPRTHPIAIAVLLAPAAIPLLFFSSLLQFFRQTRTPEPVGWAFLGFLIVGFGVIPASMALGGFLRSRWGHTSVSASADGIDIRERGAWRTRTTASIPSTEILDLDYSTKQSLVDSADRAVDDQVVAFGKRHGGSPSVGPRTRRVLKALSRFVKGRGITVKSRRLGLTRFGEGLEDDEIRYLHAVLWRVLTAEPTRDRTP